MGHPLDEKFAGMRAERDRLWARRDAMEAALAPLPLSAFTVAQFADLQLLADRSAVSDRSSDLEKALDRFDAFLASRKKPRATTSRTRRRSA